jgi:hypothetical protein
MASRAPLVHRSTSQTAYLKCVEKRFKIIGILMIATFVGDFLKCHLKFSFKGKSYKTFLISPVPHIQVGLQLPPNL